MRTAGDLYVAWPLTVPSAWGEWALVEVMVMQIRSDKLVTPPMQIILHRALGDEEVWVIKSRPLLFWGMKVRFAPWALVMCREAVATQIEQPKRTGPTNPNWAIGV